MSRYTLEDIMYGDKYGIESAVVAEVFKMVQQGMPAKEIKENNFIKLCKKYKEKY